MRPYRELGALRSSESAVAVYRLSGTDAVRRISVKRTGESEWLLSWDYLNAEGEMTNWCFDDIRSDTPSVLYKEFERMCKRFEKDGYIDLHREINRDVAPRKKVNPLSIWDGSGRGWLEDAFAC